MQIFVGGSGERESDILLRLADFNAAALDFGFERVHTFFDLFGRQTDYFFDEAGGFLVFA